MALISPPPLPPPSSPSSFDSSPWRWKQEFFFFCACACLPATSVPSLCPRFPSNQEVTRGGGVVLVGGGGWGGSSGSVARPPKPLSSCSEKKAFGGKCVICLVGKRSAVINEWLTREHAHVFRTRTRARAPAFQGPAMWFLKCATY